MSKAAERAAIVTGGGHGIGHGIAETLLRAGWSVAIGDKDAARCDSARAALGGLGPLRVLPMDVAIETDVRRLVAMTRDAFGGIDGLVCNAAIAEPEQTPVPELSLEEWQRRLTVNLTSVFLCAKHALPHLQERRGAIVNVSSTRALMSEPHTEAYAASKGGMEALTHALAISHGPHVRVNAIRPGWIDSRDEKLREREPLKRTDHEQHPVGRVGLPRDVGGAVAWLLSEESAFMTGQILTLDGGMTRKMIYD